RIAQLGGEYVAAVERTCSRIRDGDGIACTKRAADQAGSNACSRGCNGDRKIKIYRTEIRNACITGAAPPVNVSGYYIAEIAAYSPKVTAAYPENFNKIALPGSCRY